MRGWPGGVLLAATAACLLAATPVARAHPGSGIVVDAAANVYFVHTFRGVGKIDPQGKLTYLNKNSGGHFLALDTEGKFSRAAGNRLFERITPAGAKPALLFASGGAPLVVHRDGFLYYGGGFPGGDDITPGGLTIARMAADGKQSVFDPELKARLADMNQAVTGLAAGPDGALYIAGPSAILKLKPDGTLATLVRPVVVPDCDDPFDHATDSPFFHAPYLRGLAVADDGTVYAAVTGCRALVKVTADGRVETVLKSEPPWTPTGVAAHGKEIFVLEYDHPEQHTGWSPRVRKLAHDGQVTTLAAP